MPKTLTKLITPKIIPGIKNLPYINCAIVVTLGLKRTNINRGVKINKEKSEIKVMGKGLPLLSCTTTLDKHIAV